MEKLVCFLLLLVPVISDDIKGVIDYSTMLDVEGIKSNACTDRNHIFLTPGVLNAGGVSRACISRFYYESIALMVVYLRTADGLVTTFVRELPPGDGGCIDISVPLLPNTKAELTVNIRYPDSQKCTWERSIQLRVVGSRVVSIFTERSRYRPGDSLRARIFVFKPDLNPAAGSIKDIWVEDPNGGIIWHRRDVVSRLGAAQFQFELDSAAPPGKWRLKVKLADGTESSTPFWVGNYDRAPFLLSVRHQPKVLRTSEKLLWVVCVRYPWTEAVEGMLVIRIRGAGTSILNETNSIRTAIRLKSPKACHRHTAAAKRIGLNEVNSPDVVVADFAFQEEGTGMWQNTTVVSQVVDKRVTLQFMTKNQAIISSGLPNKLKVKAIRWDDKPSSNERIRICRVIGENIIDRSTTAGVCEDANTDASGIAKLVFNSAKTGSYYKVQAFLKNETSIKTEPLLLPIQKRGSLQISLGSLKVDKIGSKTFVPLYLSEMNITNAITVHFVVITRGGVIYRWGATTQCPITSSINSFRIVPRNGHCEQIMPDYVIKESPNETKLDKRYDELPQFDDSFKLVDGNKTDALYNRRFPKVMLPVKLTPQMCPKSHLIAYFYYNEEFVSASKYFEMEDCFVNKVELTWMSRQVAPGLTATLQIKTPGPALCAVSVLDTASKWNQPEPLPTFKENIIKSLRRMMEQHSNLTEYDASRECFLIADKPDTPTSSANRAAAWLAAAGVRAVGGQFSNIRFCLPIPETLVEEEHMPRSDFSESWLWRMAVVGLNGTTEVSARTPDSITRYEASVICVARNGISVSNNATLQVFREFFIHADAPKRLRQGDTTIINYRIFNYLYEKLSIRIFVLPSPQLEAPSGSEYACVPARTSVVRRIEVRAKVVGAAKLSIRAVTVEEGCGSTSRTNISDEVIIQMTVDPEGVLQRQEKSVLLCEADEDSSDVSWSWPEVQSVPGTEYVAAWITADIRGPLLANADDLIMMPRGCGEQNMARLAYNLLAVQLLDHNSPQAATALQHVARGYTRQLQYAHPNGGFSAFGVTDGIPSTWLTAFSIKYLRKAHKVLTPDYPPPPALELAEAWIIGQQMENGCFRNEGQVFHRELKGHQIIDADIASVALTAYVITSLLDSPPIATRIIDNAMTCLRALPTKTKSPATIYAQALLTYTFMKLKNYEIELKKSNEVSPMANKPKQHGRVYTQIVELMDLAKNSQNYVWWETGTLSTTIEATSYALLALANCPQELMTTYCVPEAQGVIRWLSTHRNSFGGFVSTQDTLVALEALVAWSAAVPSDPTNLSVIVKGPTKKSFNLKSGAKVPEVFKMLSARNITVSVKGSGCALVQATRFYHTLNPEAKEDNTLSVKVTVNTDGPFNCDQYQNSTNCYCAAVVEACVLWTGCFPEMALLEMSLPGGYRADASLLYSQIQKRDRLLRRIELAPFGAKANLYLGSRDGSEIEKGGHNCFTLHAVGPKKNTKAAHVKIYDYYNPAITDVQLYTIPEECPPKILPVKNNYNASDNLFTKAKSIDGDLIIDFNDYNFEDIADGTPPEEIKSLKVNNKKEHVADSVVACDTTQTVVPPINNVQHINNVQYPIHTQQEAKTPVRQYEIKNDFHNACGASCSPIISDKILDYNEDSDDREVVPNYEEVFFFEPEDAQDVDIRKRANINIDVTTKPSTTTTVKPTVISRNTDHILRTNLTNLIEHLFQLYSKTGHTKRKNDSPSIHCNKHGIRKAKSENDKHENEIGNKISAAKTNVTEHVNIDIRLRNNSHNNNNRTIVNNSGNNKHVDINLNNSESNKVKTNNTDVEHKNSENKKYIESNNNPFNKSGNNSTVSNPLLSDFHVIDSSVDLSVPSGVEGPIPSFVLPPKKPQEKITNVVYPPFYINVPNDLIYVKPKDLANAYAVNSVPYMDRRPQSPISYQTGRPILYYTKMNTDSVFRGLVGQK